jgi:DNA invertase Pin-like site-specific DNA recombinase
MGQTAVMAHLGYTRISTAGQDDQLQRDALISAGVETRNIYFDVTSGSNEAQSCDC